MLDHYQKYYGLKRKQKELTAKIEQFNLKVQNFRRLENYSTQEIDAMAQNIHRLDEVIRRAKQYKVTDPVTAEFCGACQTVSQGYRRAEVHHQHSIHPKAQR